MEKNNTFTLKKRWFVKNIGEKFLIEDLYSFDKN
jgi:hypothetical protein